MLAVSPDGFIYVTERRAKRVVRLPDRAGDGLANGIEAVAGVNEHPCGLAFFQDGSPYLDDPGQVIHLSSLYEQGIFTERKVVNMMVIIIY